MDLIPGLPNDVAIECLTRLPFHQLPTAVSVCGGWKVEIELPEFRRLRKAVGRSRSIFVMAQAWVDPNRNHQGGLMVSATPVYRLTLCDPETGNWRELPPVQGFSDGLPMFCQLVGIGSDLVVMGGCDRVSWEASNLVFIYNFVSAEWRSGADMPGGKRSFFACASDSDTTVFVAGGHDENKNALRSAMAYDVVKDKWVPMPDMARERDECKGLFHGGKFHVIGGYCTEMQGRFEKSAEAFDVATGQWAQVHEDFLDIAKCPRTCVDGGDGRIYMCGEGNVRTMKGATWQVITGLPAEVSNATYVSTWQGKLLAIGCANFGEPHRAYVMDLKNPTWTKVEAPEEFTGHVQSGCFLEI
ncbi:F-box/kelch-repeat protein At1g80440-like [Cornus florida]|uniref:F-box/kelch-repeat protein At1g80440-like n=1 Tax=Cornus florida TaxID=4283 RepID=UPI00289DCF11|nr:F-box/kelch-repeat protein At1g80440-like [Cornus florida]